MRLVQSLLVFVLIGASLREPHIVVISITFSCPTYVLLSVR